MDRNRLGTLSLESRPVVELGVDARAQFITRTYTHLFGAIAAFTLLEIGLFESGAADNVAGIMMGSGRGGWLLILGAFVVVGWLARSAANRADSKHIQYAALGAYVVAEALIFVPILWFAKMRSPGTIESAAFVTLVGFSGLTAVAVLTRKDFSFLGSLLRWGGICVFLLILASFIFGFYMGVWFSVAMIAFAGAAILYDTSNILLHTSEDRYVAASLELFASVALLFYYVLRLMNSRR
jgi:FtsH-binding integral membrane protein